MAAAVSLLSQTWSPHSGAYDYVLTLNDEEVAWEGLRRNPHYQRDYRLSAARHSKARRQRSGRCIWRAAGPRSGSERWGLHCFRRPDLNAPEAPIQWITDPGTAVLEAVARRAPPGTPASFVLADQTCIRHVVIGPGDMEHLLIRTSERSLTVRIAGHHASRGPVHLKFVIPAESRVKETAAILASYPDLLTMRPRWVKKTSEQMLTRDAFIAFDGRAAGATHREVAEAIHGQKRVREEWSGRGCSMKERVRRALAKGQALCHGGHWKLIEQACRSRGS